MGLSINNDSTRATTVITKFQQEFKEDMKGWGQPPLLKAHLSILSVNLPVERLAPLDRLISAKINQATLQLLKSSNFNLSKDDKKTCNTLLKLDRFINDHTNEIETLKQLLILHPNLSIVDEQTRFVFETIFRNWEPLKKEKSENPDPITDKDL